MVRGRLPADSARVVVVDVGGRTLGIELTGEDFDYVAWFRKMADELGMEVVVTDDARAYDGGVEESGLSRQQCPVHIKRGLGRAKSRLSEQMPERYGWLLKRMRELLKELPADGAERLREWAVDKELPEELRLLAVRLLNRWRQMTLHRRVAGVPDSTNWVEGRFGRIKPRYRSTRGLKTDAGAVNFMSVVCDVLN